MLPLRLNTIQGDFPCRWTRLTICSLIMTWLLKLFTIANKIVFHYTAYLILPYHAYERHLLKRISFADPAALCITQFYRSIKVGKTATGKVLNCPSNRNTNNLHTCHAWYEEGNKLTIGWLYDGNYDTKDQQYKDPATSKPGKRMNNPRLLHIFEAVTNPEKPNEKAVKKKIW